MSEVEFSYFCPQCSSARIDTVMITEQALCRECGWNGQRTELLHMPMGQGSSPEQLIARFTHEIAVGIAKNYAQTFAVTLLSWGFLEQENLQEELKLYVGNAARGVVASVLRTRELLEIERKKRKEGVPKGKSS